MNDDTPEINTTPPEKRDLYYEDKQFRCSKCDKEITEEQSKFNLCKTCEEQAQGFFQFIMGAFSQDERAFLNWRYDGEVF